MGRDRPHEAIARMAGSLWRSESTYLAEPRRVLQARDTALVVAACGINVVRRGGDGEWRYAISLLSLDSTTTEEDA